MTEAPEIGQTLGAFLVARAPADAARALNAIAAAAITVAQVIRRGALAGPLGAVVGPAHDGFGQKALDVFADEAFVNGLEGSGVRAVVSEERDAPVAVDPKGTLLVAIDPLDGSSNIDVNVAIGTVFSVLDAPSAAEIAPEHFLQPGARQRAAGFLVYGPHVCFVFTTGAGTHVATLDPDRDVFRMTQIDARIPEDANEFAINASNSRHWPEPIRAYVEDCLAGEEGPREKNFNMRWIASTVADVYRILVRGGVYLYPEDEREGYAHGRLRLLYEANPIALIVEQAGGAAIDGLARILDLTPQTLHGRTPFIFGSTKKVEGVEHYYRESGPPAARSPLFGKRGLLRR